MNKYIKQQIFELESKLLSANVRSSAEEIKKLLSHNFMEFCSSGKIYKYSEGDTFHEDGVNFEIIDFDLSKISEKCVLAKYKLKKEFIKDKITIQSIRSSIWKYNDKEWKMLFHQGTLIK